MSNDKLAQALRELIADIKRAEEEAMHCFAGIALVRAKNALAAHEAEKQAGPVAIQAEAPAPDVEAAWADLRKDFPVGKSGWTVGDAGNFRVMFERGFRAALKGIQAPAAAPSAPPSPPTEQAGPVAVEPYGYLRQSTSAANPPHGWAFHFAGRPGDVAVYTKAALQSVSRTSPQTEQDKDDAELPPMPESQCYVKVWIDGAESLEGANSAYYTAEQMQVYARAARAKKEQQC